MNKQEQIIIKRVNDSLATTVNVVATMRKIVVAAVDLLEQNDSDKVSKRPMWPELAIDNAVEYIHEAADCWERMFVLNETDAEIIPLEK